MTAKQALDLIAPGDSRRDGKLQQPSAVGRDLYSCWSCGRQEQAKSPFHREA
jgi:hypothetical protein